MEKDNFNRHNHHQGADGDLPPRPPQQKLPPFSSPLPSSALPSCGVKKIAFKSEPQSTLQISGVYAYSKNEIGHHRFHSQTIKVPKPEESVFNTNFSGPSFTGEDHSMYHQMGKFNTSSSSSSISEPLISPPQLAVKEELEAKNGSSLIKIEQLSFLEGVSISDKTRKPLLEAELALVDSKCAKRLRANRQSAARSRAEREAKLQNLETEAAALSVQLAMLKRDTSILVAEHNELTVQLQTMERQSHLRNVLNNALLSEINDIKMEIDQLHGGSSTEFRPPFGTTQELGPHQHVRSATSTSNLLQQLQNNGSPSSPSQNVYDSDMDSSSEE